MVSDVQITHVREQVVCLGAIQTASVHANLTPTPERTFRPVHACLPVLAGSHSTSIPPEIDALGFLLYHRRRGWNGPKGTAH